MLCFMVMTLGYRLEPRVAVPTAVLIMAATSAVGFTFRLLQSKPIGVAWGYWAVAVPIVMIGAPLGAWVASKVRADVILGGVLVLIAAEVVSSTLLIPLDAARLGWVAGVSALAVLWLRRLQRLAQPSA